MIEHTTPVIKRKKKNLAPCLVCGKPCHPTATQRCPLCRITTCKGCTRVFTPKSELSEYCAGCRTHRRRTSSGSAFTIF
jgi:hypothetical protein